MIYNDYNFSLRSLPADTKRYNLLTLFSSYLIGTPISYLNWRHRLYKLVFVGFLLELIKFI